MRKVVSQEVSRRDMTHSTQGKYAFTADGLLFGFDNHGTEGLVRVKGLLEKALREFKPVEEIKTGAGRMDPRYDRPMPEGTVVVDVTMKVLGGYKEGEPEDLKLFRGILGRERLWILKDEAAALASGSLPDSLKKRLVRYHLYDNTRGQHNAGWAVEAVKKLDLALAAGRLTGTADLREGPGGREYQAGLLGFVEAKEGRLTRFDVVAKGLFSENPVRPDLPSTEGKFPLAIAFRLADPKDPGHRVPPACARDYEGYLRR